MIHTICLWIYISHYLECLPCSMRYRCGWQQHGHLQCMRPIQIWCRLCGLNSHCDYWWLWCSIKRFISLHKHTIWMWMMMNVQQSLTINQQISRMFYRNPHKHTHTLTSIFELIFAWKTGQPCVHFPCINIYTTRIRHMTKTTITT